MLRAIGKTAGSLLLLALLYREVVADHPEEFHRLLLAPKEWSSLAMGWGAFLVAHLVGTARWWLLLYGARVRVRYGETLQAGLLGFLFDFLGLGPLGGDVIKSVALSRGRPEQSRASIVGAVLVDRVVGLLALLSWAGGVALAGAGMDGFLGSVGLAAGVAGAVLAATLIAVGLLRPKPAGMVAWSEFVPLIGPRLYRVFQAAIAYADRPRVPFVAYLLSLAVLAVNVTGFFYLARGLATVAPEFSQQVVVVPFALLVGVLPLPADALGALDLAMNELYRVVAADASAAGLGLLVVMAYRLLNVALCLVGAYLYLRGTGRGEVFDVHTGQSDGF